MVLSVTQRVEDCLGEPLGQWPDETTTLACRPSHRPEKETGSSEEGVAGRPWERRNITSVGNNSNGGEGNGGDAEATKKRHGAAAAGRR